MAQSPYFKSVTKLDLLGNNVGDSGAIALADSPYVSNLKYLNLTMMRPGVGPEGVQAIATSPNLCNLEELFVDGRGYYKPTDFASTRDFSKPNSAIEVARSPFLTRLKSLELSNQDFGDEGMIELANSPVLRNVTRLLVDGNQITDVGALALANSPHLRQVSELNISYNAIGEEGAMALFESAIFADEAIFLIYDCLLSEDRSKELYEYKSGRRVS